MKIHPVSVTMLGLLSLALLAWTSLHDDISCVVTGSDLHVSGYYVAVGGVYVRKGHGRVGVFPDFFAVNAISRIYSSDDSSTIIISQDKHRWLIQEQRGRGHGGGGGVTRRLLYYTTPEHPQHYLFHPPTDSWKKVETVPNEQISDSSPRNSAIVSSPSDLHVGHFRGSLADSAPDTIKTNMATIIARPVTMVILCAILFIAYRLWAYRVPVSDVSFSYDAVVNNGEYWRGITASFAHFEVMHLGFNCLSFYQLGELEEGYGSVAFFYLNMNLVVITMVLCVLFYYLLITRGGKAHLVYQQAVGYSCVLFAWMVAASVRMTEYCPLFFLPSLCFPTWSIPIPFTDITGLPVNLGPFLLLIVTKLILPQSSLTGHLAGIVIGFPLAWGMLDWITPPVLGAILVGCYVYLDGLWVWRLPGYSRYAEMRPIESSTNVSMTGICSFSNDVVLEGVVSPQDLKEFQWLRFAGAMLAVETLLVFPFCAVQSSSLSSALTTQFWHQIFPHLTLLGMVYMSYEARRCEWLTTSHVTQQQCATIIYVTLAMALIMLSCDVLTLVSVLTATNLLRFSSGLSTTAVAVGCSGVCILALIHLAVICTLIRCLQNIACARITLESWKLDATSMRAYLTEIGFIRKANAFEGRGHTMMGRAPQQPEAEEGNMPAQISISLPQRNIYSHEYSSVTTGSLLEDMADDYESQEQECRSSNKCRISEAGAAALARLERTGKSTQDRSNRK